jgi:hypothetical protein
MKVGDLIKFTHVTKPKENDIGLILGFSSKKREALVLWSKTGKACISLSTLLKYTKRFEVLV